MTIKKKFSEVDLAQAVINTLREWKWEIYQEVVGHGGRCDIVAKQKNIIWAIECKNSFGFQVLDQAYNWIRNGSAHYVSIAVPWKSITNNKIGKKICLDYGIGVLYVSSSNSDNVQEIIQPKLRRKIAIPFRLCDDQKIIKSAGSTGGGYWTPFRQTVNRLISLVERKPGIEFNKLIKELDHHYSSLSSAKSCLRNFIGTNVIPELIIKEVNGKLCVFLNKKIKSKKII